MKEHWRVLQRSILFSRMTEAEMTQIAYEFLKNKKAYQKAEIILLNGTIIQKFGLLLSGSLNILKEDLEGNQILLARIEPGELFAETFACSGQALTVTVEAAEISEVIWMNYHDILLGNQGNQVYGKILENLLQIFAGKNLFLTRRIEHLTKRTLKEKLMSYLLEQSQRAGSRSFQIPFDRQGLADYLAADRSAVSFVLCKMQEEGLIAFRKNHFYLKE